MKNFFMILSFKYKYRKTLKYYFMKYFFFCQEVIFLIVLHQDLGYSHSEDFLGSHNIVLFVRFCGMNSCKVWKLVRF